MIKEFASHTRENGGRVAILFLLFLLALWQFYSSGFSAFAIICALPIVALVVIVALRYKMLSFWALIVINYLVMWHGAPLPSGIPTSLYNEMLELLLIALAIVNVKEVKFERLANIMGICIMVWCTFCTLEVLNDTCGLGINAGAWYQGARMMAFQLFYAFVVFTLYISNPKILIKYLYVWGILALFASFWVWKQKNIGFMPAESSWLHGAGSITHIIAGGTLIRYFSIYSDAANFGVGIASTAVAFIIFGITTKIKKHKIFFFTVGIAAAWAMFPSGTRTAIACFMAGILAYVFLSKSFKIAIPVSIFFGIFVFVLVNILVIKKELYNLSIGCDIKQVFLKMFVIK